jgi:hypothetical protein
MKFSPLTDKIGEGGKRIISPPSKPSHDREKLNPLCQIAPCRRKRSREIARTLSSGCCFEATREAAASATKLPRAGAHARKTLIGGGKMLAAEVLSVPVPARPHFPRFLPARPVA